MDYKKLHKDTITNLQKMVNSGKITVKVARKICADFTPESEDERIRKKLLALIEWSKSYTASGITTDEAKEMTAWIEKQGEKGTNGNEREIPNSVWSEEDEKMLTQIINEIEAIKSNSSTVFEKNIAQDKINWLKSLKPQNTWKPSDEQIKALSAINVTGAISYAGQGQELIDLYNDLKNLREE